MCMASIPPSRIKNRFFCSDPVASECVLYAKMVERHGVKKREDGL